MVANHHGHSTRSGSHQGSPQGRPADSVAQLVARRSWSIHWPPPKGPRLTGPLIRLAPVTLPLYTAQRSTPGHEQHHPHCQRIQASRSRTHRGPRSSGLQLLRRPDAEAPEAPETERPASAPLPDVPATASAAPAGLHSPEQSAALAAPLNRVHVQTRSQAGRSLNYLEELAFAL